jgi:HEAT repeat protein
MWLDFTLVVGMVLAATAWLAMSAYVVAVQRRRDGTRDTLARTLTALVPMTAAAPAERLAAARELLKGASRELVMHAAAERDVASHVFEALVGLLDERWSLDRLTSDASAHATSRDKWRRMTSLRILARLQHPQALDLLARAVADSDVDVATCGLSLLGESSDPRAMDLLLEALTSPKLSASRVAVYIDQSPQDVGDRLVSLLDHAEPTVRQWAATLLQRYPEQPTTTRLVAMTRDADPRVRKAAIQTLGRLDRQEAVTCGLQLLTDPVPYVRAHAVRAIGELGRTDLATRICPLLGDGDWWVRLATREALEMMGTDVWPVMVRCLEHRDKFVRNGAAEVVQNLGVLDSLIVLEAASDNPNAVKVEMLQRIAAAGGVRFTESLVERAGPVIGPRIRRLLDVLGVEQVGAA